MYHYRKTRQTYIHHNKSDKAATCSFAKCSDKAGETQPTLFENDTMYVIPNRVSYDLFEGRDVLDHVMVIPKRHVESIDDFTDAEKIDAMSIMGDYEAREYNVYARGVNSVSRSVKHQHTHLIKVGNQKPRAYFFLTKPYFLFRV